MGGKLDVQSRFGEARVLLRAGAARGRRRGALGGSAPAPSRRQPNARSKARMLLAEDNGLNAEIAVALLDMRGSRRSVRRTGARPWTCLRRIGPGSFDFVLMDVKMPLLDGLGRQLRSARSSATTRARCPSSRSRPTRSRKTARMHGGGRHERPSQTLRAQQLYDTAWLPASRGVKVLRKPDIRRLVTEECGILFGCIFAPGACVYSCPAHAVLSEESWPKPQINKPLKSRTPLRKPRSKPKTSWRRRPRRRARCGRRRRQA